MESFLGLVARTLEVPMLEEEENGFFPKGENEEIKTKNEFFFDFNELLNNRLNKKDEKDEKIPIPLMLAKNKIEAASLILCPEDQEKNEPTLLEHKKTELEEINTFPFSQVFISEFKNFLLLRNEFSIAEETQACLPQKGDQKVTEENQLELSSQETLESILSEDFPKILKKNLNQRKIFQTPFQEFLAYKGETLKKPETILNFHEDESQKIDCGKENKTEKERQALEPSSEAFVATSSQFYPEIKIVPTIKDSYFKNSKSSELPLKVYPDASEDDAVSFNLNTPIVEQKNLIHTINEKDYPKSDFQENLPDSFSFPNFQESSKDKNLYNFARKDQQIQTENKVIFEPKIHEKNSKILDLKIEKSDEEPILKRVNSNSEYSKPQRMDSSSEQNLDFFTKNQEVIKSEKIFPNKNKNIQGSNVPNNTLHGMTKEILETSADKDEDQFFSHELNFSKLKKESENKAEAVEINDPFPWNKDLSINKENFLVQESFLKQKNLEKKHGISWDKITEEILQTTLNIQKDGKHQAIIDLSQGEEICRIQIKLFDENVQVYLESSVPLWKTQFEQQLPQLAQVFKEQNLDLKMLDHPLSSSFQQEEEKNNRKEPWKIRGVSPKLNVRA